jgi:predicted dehydrogenase
MLTTCRPDVVHITTPPQSHFKLAKQCIEAGCNVYVEKPLTMYFDEAKELVSIAEKNSKKLTVGHETQFTPVAMDMRRLIDAGYLGGPPVHMESVFGYQFSDEQYAKALLGDRNHWVRRLPGGLLQNIISHGICKIAEYLQDDAKVVAKGFTSRFLHSIGETGIIDELRVIVSDSRLVTAYFTFSSQISPAPHQFRVYGARNSLIADNEHQTLIKVPIKTYKSYLNQFIPPFANAKQYFQNGCKNIKGFLRRDLHAESGMFRLISMFYESISGNASLPIPYKDILLTSRIMEDIFSQLGGGVDSIAAQKTQRQAEGSR